MKEKFEQIPLNLINICKPKGKSQCRYLGQKDNKEVCLKITSHKKLIEDLFVLQSVNGEFVVANGDYCTGLGEAMSPISIAINNLVGRWQIKINNPNYEAEWGIFEGGKVTSTKRALTGRWFLESDVGKIRMTILWDGEKDAWETLESPFSAKEVTGKTWHGDNFVVTATKIQRVHEFDYGSECD